MPDLPTGTVTFLFTDIEGSTKLWEEYPHAMREALARHDALLHQTIRAHRGSMFKTMGDAFCAAFATAPEALAAALDAQRALNNTRPHDLSLRVRMAIHTGAAEQRDGDYFGPVLSRVARLLAAAHGGQTLLSLASEELTRDALPPSAGLRDLGSHRLRDLQRPEHVFQLLHPDLPADFPPLKSLDTLPNNLPRQLTSFVGREREMAEVKRLLSTACLLTLTGSGGCGKTRLAVQVAADLLDEYPDGVWLVELAALSDPALVPQGVCSALGVREEPGRPLIGTLADYLKSRSLLLILDNCEHLIEACARFAERLLQFCGNLGILVTSREALGIGGELTYRVPSLSLPAAYRQPPRGTDLASTLTQYEAVRLFIERASAALPGFAVTNRNAPAVAQVCDRLDGIPLALELAAARVKVLSPEQIAERLGDRFRLLTGGSRTALPRQQTLRAMIDWSYDLLGQKERMLLRRLSVFAGGWTLPAAESVCAGEGIEAWEVLDLLAELVDKSLVLVEEQTPAHAPGPPGTRCPEPRYRLLETMRQYGRDRLREAGEEAQVRERHYQWYLSLAREAQAHFHGSEQVAWLDRLEVEHDNLRAALLARGAEEGGPEKSLRLLGELWQFWELRSYLSEGREHLANGLGRVEAAEPTLEQAKALYGAGRLTWCQGDYAPARSYYEGSLKIFEALGNRRGVATALNGLGNVAQFQCDWARARSLYEQSLAIRREFGDEGAIASVLINLGAVLTDQGDYASAHVFLEESRTIARELDDKWVAGILRWALGNLAIAERDFASARTVLDEAMTMATELGTTWCIPYALEGFGCLAAAEGLPARAARLLGAAEALRESLGTSLPPSERARRDPSIAAVRAGLGDEAFAAAWAEGRAMTPERAVAYAREEQPS